MPPLCLHSPVEFRLSSRRADAKQTRRTRPMYAEHMWRLFERCWLRVQRIWATYAACTRYVCGTCVVGVRYVDSPYVPHTCHMCATRLEHSAGICTTYAHPRPPPAWLSATPVKPPTPWARHTGEVGRETESMCGRFASTQTDAELLDVFRAVDVVGEQLPPSYNVAPTQPVRVVLERPPRDAPEDTPVRRIRTVRWGLVPSWARDTKIG